MQFVVMAAGAALAAFGGWLYARADWIIYVPTIAILVAGGVVTIALGAVVHAVLALRADLRTREVRRRLEAGDGATAWRGP